MSRPGLILASPPSPADIDTSRALPRPSLRPMWFALLVVALMFAVPLYRLADFALHSDLYSYILLIPCVSGFIAWRKFPRPSSHSRPHPLTGILFMLGGGAILAGYLFASSSVAELAPSDQLALTTTAFLLTATGAAICFLDRVSVGALLFPIGFLGFMIPIPSQAMEPIESLMQHGSAAVAKLLFGAFGTPVFYQDLNFQLPGINLHVAPECSGIRSTIALTIVSVVTGYFFLRSPVSRVLLAMAVLPLALARNGLRIFTVGELCVRLGPQMIDSYIHRHGGPIFFALSLVPFFYLVMLLQRREHAATAKLA